jgi:hypothetical protein
VLTINDSKSDKVAGKIDVFFRQSSIFVGEVGMRLCLIDINFRHPSTPAYTFGPAAPAQDVQV